MLNTVPVTPAFVKGVACSVTTAQTDKTGATSANIVTLYTADGSSSTSRSAGQGSLIQDVTVSSPATTAAGCVCVFKNVGGTRYLLKEVSVGAVTSSTTATGFNSGKLVLNEWLSPGDKIDVLTTITQTFHVCGNVAEY